MSEHFPGDAPKKDVLRALKSFGFVIVREREHIALQRTNKDGTVTPLTMPNHVKLKGSTLRAICTQAGISRHEFMDAFYKRKPER
jgi:predicted RNA binding protein YcfA (HicA-like mRNA interferase family)